MSLEKYYADFKNHKINGQRFISLTEIDLKEKMNVRELGNRKRLIKIIEHLKNRKTNNIISSQIKLFPENSTTETNENSSSDINSLYSKNKNKIENIH